MKSGDRLNIEQDAQTAAIDALELGHADHERRISALESVPPPPVIPPVVTPPPVIIPPDPPAPDGRRFGCNAGYKDDTTWSPEGNHADPRYALHLAPVAKCLRFEWWRANDDVNKGGGLTDERKARVKRYVSLCNQLGSDIHYCFLLHDNEATVRWIVKYVRQNLRVGATKFFETANEVWNGGSYNSDGVDIPTGRAVYLEICRLSGWPNYWKDGNTAWFQTAAEIFSKQFKIIEDEDPGAITVLGCLTANPWWMDGVQDRMTMLPKAHGCTFYFGAGIGSNPLTNLTVDQLFAASEAKLPKEIELIEDHANASKARGMLILGYEGGPHWAIAGNKHNSHPIVWKNMNKANRDPRMVPLCERIAAAAEKAGYIRLNWYNYMTLYDVHGSWGLGENLDTITTNPKYRFAAGL